MSESVYGRVDARLGSVGTGSVGSDLLLEFGRHVSALES